MGKINKAFVHYSVRTKKLINTKLRKRVILALNALFGVKTGYSMYGAGYKVSVYST
jgi:hypothetical protein